MATDASGNLYVVGRSSAPWSCTPTPCTVRAYTAGGSQGMDAFVAKLDPSGALVWNTFLGGNNEDSGYRVQVDASGNVYVLGNSNATWESPVAPFTAPIYETFVAKLDQTGALAWNTFVGGAGNTSAWGLAVGGSSVYVVGSAETPWTCSPTPCTARPYTQGYDTYLVALNTSGALVWNSFLGGASMVDLGNDVSLDAGGNIYVAGESDLAWSCPADCTVRPFTTGSSDAFIAKTDASGNLLWNTFLGGTDSEKSSRIVVDTSANSYLVGTGFNTWGTPVRAYGSGGDAFAAKVDATGTLLWNTFLGGGLADYASGITLDSDGDIYVTGTSYDTWGDPTLPYNGNQDGYIAKLTSSGVLAQNMFLGSTAWDYETAPVLDAGRHVLVAGSSAYTWGSPLNPWTASLSDAFVAKADFPPAVISIARANASPTSAASVRFTVGFSDPVTGVDTTAFLLNTTFLTGASITDVIGSGDTYTVTVNTGQGNGTIRLDLVDDNSIVDTGGRFLGGPDLGDGSYASGEVYTVKKIPVPKTPTGSIWDTTPTYKWTTIPKAAQYRYQLAQGTATLFTKAILSSSCGLTCTQTPSTPLVPGTYKWRVQALVGSHWSSYSPYKSFTLYAPKAGYWKGFATEFYVTVSRMKVDNFAITVGVTGCGTYKVMNSSPVPISSSGAFGFSHAFYASGKFNKTSTSPTSASGSTGLNNYFISGCGYATGGPWSWKVNWQNTSQPSAASLQAMGPITVSPMLDAPSEFLTIDGVQPVP